VLIQHNRGVCEVNLYSDGILIPSDIALVDIIFDYVVLTELEIPSTLF